MQEVQDTYQVFVSNIKWGDAQQFAHKSKYVAKRVPPEHMTFDVPTDRVEKFQKSKSFDDEIEAYIYNTLTNKFGREVTYCQVWLPLD